MKWRNYTLDEQIDRINQKYDRWHKWFAWYPIAIDDYTYWLEFVYRRGSTPKGINNRLVYENGKPVIQWRYAKTMFDILKIDEKETSINKILQSPIDEV